MTAQELIENTGYLNLNTDVIEMVAVMRDTTIDRLAQNTALLVYLDTACKYVKRVGGTLASRQAVAIMLATFQHV